MDWGFDLLGELLFSLFGEVLCDACSCGLWSDRDEKPGRKELP